MIPEYLSYLLPSAAKPSISIEEDIIKKMTIYERRDYVSEDEASVSLAMSRKNDEKS